MKSRATRGKASRSQEGGGSGIAGYGPPYGMQCAPCVALPAATLQAAGMSYVWLTLALGILVLALAPYWAPLAGLGPPAPLPRRGS